MKLYLISLGCAKNLVDSEVVIGKMVISGFTYAKNISDADVIILNTCAFVSSARKEGKKYIRKIVNYINSKDANSIKPLFIVTGCLPQLEKDKLIAKYPEIDAIIGVDEFIKIPYIVKKLSHTKNQKLSSKNYVKQNKILVKQIPYFIYSSSTPRTISTPKSYAYLKIADGCDNRCSYCLIPTIRGEYRERSIEDIVAEAKKIVSYGTKELILISQDTTFYGTKIYKKPMLHILLQKLSKIKDLYWIRILYTNPKHFYPELIKTIAGIEKVCKYVDIPIQHTDDKILAQMGRGTRKHIFETIEQLRKNVPNITLRTTIMVGFPTETEKQFNTLVSDIKNLQFDSLGCFKYENQPNTKSFYIDEQIPEKIKDLRYNNIMQTQQKIVYKKNNLYIGKTFPVLIDTQTFGHTEFQTPEVDGKIIFSNSENNTPASIVKSKIVSISKIYDLVAEKIFSQPIDKKK